MLVSRVASHDEAMAAHALRTARSYMAFKWSQTVLQQACLHA
jgi:hypothetical protein